MEIQFKPTQKQHLMFQYFDDAETTEVLYGGGVGSAKSYGICCLIIMKALMYENIRIGLARNELTTLKRTTVVSLFEVMTDWGLISDEHYKYNSQAGEIVFNNKSKIVLLELAYNPSDPQYTRLGGQLLTFAAIDECGESIEKAKQILQSRLGRWKNKIYNIKPILYMTCNPSKNFLFAQFYKADLEGNLPTYRKFIKALINDNPYISQEYYDNLMKTLSFSDKKRLIQGDWDYDDNPNALLEYDDIKNIFVNEKPKADAPIYYISADIAFTSDKCVLIAWEGLTIIEIKVLENNANIKPEDAIKDLATKYNVKSHHIVYDSDGIAKYLVNYLPNAKAIVNNAKALNGENYENLKTQLYFKLTELIKNNKIKIVLSLNHKDEIIEELQMIQHKVGDGKIQLVKKDEIKRKIGRSPDYSDAMAYRMIWEIKNTQFNTEFYSFTF
jgi:hypothetical protein